MNANNNKVSFILIDGINHPVKDNEPDEHFQFVQNLAKNFDKSRFIKPITSSITRESLIFININISKLKQTK